MKYANEEVESLKKDGFSAHIVEADLDNLGHVFRVRLDELMTKEEANTRLKEMKEKGWKDCYVYEVKQ